MITARALSSPSGEAAEDKVVEREKFFGAGGITLRITDGQTDVQFEICSNQKRHYLKHSFIDRWDSATVNVLFQILLAFIFSVFFYLFLSNFFFQKNLLAKLGWSLYIKLDEISF